MLPLSKGSFSIGYIVVVVVAIMPYTATIATTPKIAIIVVLLNWITNSTTRQVKNVLYYHIYELLSSAASKFTYTPIVYCI